MGPTAELAGVPVGPVASRQLAGVVSCVGQAAHEELGVISLIRGFGSKMVFWVVSLG